MPSPRRTRRKLHHAGVATMLCLFACVATVAADAAPTQQPLTLAAAVELGLRQGSTTRIAQHESARAAGAAAAARSVYLPQAQVTSRAGYSSRINERLRAVDSDGIAREYGLATLGGGEGWFNAYVHQVLFDLSHWADVRRAAQEAEVAQLAEVQAREETSRRVLDAYVGVLRLAALVEQQERWIEHALRLDERAAILLQTGRSLQAEREEVALYLREVQIGLRRLEAQLRTAKHGLELLIGGAPHEGGWSPVESSLPQIDDDASAMLERVEESPEIRLLALRHRIEELRLQSLRAGHYPTVGVGAAYSHYGAKRYDNFADEMRVGIDFRLQVFDGFKTRLTIGAAEQAVAAARLQQRAAIDRKRLRLQELADELETALLHLPLAAERLRLGEERIRLADIALDSQRGSISLALAARREVERSIESALRARHEPILVWGSIQAEVGNLGASLLATLVATDKGA